MKKNFTKKLVLKKHTVVSLNAEKLKALRGGRARNSIQDCSQACGYQDTINYTGLYIDGMCW